MITSKVFLTKNALILGMGVTGKSIAESLYKSGANIFFWDDNPIIRKKFKVKKYQIFFDNKKNWNKIDFLVVSPGFKTKGIKAHKLIKLAKKINVKLLVNLIYFKFI